ncbi:MAG: GreA/GreB family elongation factor [Planctomycetes bacterium]|nr:GreA/GreB family elongation factor [Planctomycetota bacterium]
MTETYVSRSQFDALMGELRKAEEDLSRARLSIGEAAEKGDLSENSEYDAAREAEQFFLARVVQFRERLAVVRIIDKKLDFNGEVGIGTRIVVLDIKTSEQETYIIVGGGSFDFDKGELPYNAPFAAGFVGRRAGEEVLVKVPVGTLKYRIISVEPAE